MPLTGIPTFVEKQKVKPSLLNTIFGLIVGKFNAGIRSVDCAADAGFTGGQLSSAPGTRITVNNLEDGCVDHFKLKSDATPSSPQAAVSTANHIVDGIITAAKLVAGTLTKSQMAITVHTVAFNSGLLVPGVALQVTANPSIVFDKATYDLIGLFIKDLGAGLIPNTTYWADDTGANWAGNVRCHNPAGSSQTLTGTLVYVFLKKA